MKGACDQLRRWTYAGGKQWKGLMTRREIEREICLWGQHDLPPRLDTTLS
ncbi:hypothetical protein Q5578_13725 [Escherichia coli]|nr:hypothetical protein [Escherichia coli]MED8664102.1 hypothetical protein [Escherichia coli]